MKEELKSFMLPQSTHEAILDASLKHPNLKPSEIIERALELFQTSNQKVRK